MGLFNKKGNQTSDTRQNQDHHTASLYIFGVTYKTNNHQIYIKYVIDAWTPILHIINLSYLLNILRPLIYILLRLTEKFYISQLLNDQNCKLVGSHAVKIYIYGESTCNTLLPCSLIIVLVD